MYLNWALLVLFSSALVVVIVPVLVPSRHVIEWIFDSANAGAET